MRRVIIASALLLAILALACWSLIDLYAGTDELAAACIEIQKAADSASDDALAAQAESLRARWEKLESRFVLYIRHDHLDQLSGEIARLPMLGQYGDRGEYLSGIDHILTVLEDIRRSAAPSYRNLL